MTHEQLRKLIWANAFIAAGVKFLEAGEDVRVYDESGWVREEEYRNEAKTDEASAAEFADIALAQFDEKWKEEE